jgi:elongation factor P
MAGEFKNGMILEIDGVLWQVVYFQHLQTGRSGSFVRTKIKNVLQGNVVERTYRGDERPNEVTLQHRQVTYSYNDGEFYYFMDQQTFEMIPLSADVIGDEQLKYLKENMECVGLVYEDRVIAVELPNFVELQVIQTDPGVRGDSARGGTKPATLETGAIVQVPLFVEEGDVLKVDRREDKYLTRVTG